MPQDKAESIRVHHYLGWIILAIVVIPLIAASLVLHVKEDREMAANSTRWKENWSQLKVGMSKEEVLALVGAPNSTTTLETKPENVTIDPPDEKIEQDVREKLTQIDNYTLWSYYAPVVIHTYPGEDPRIAVVSGEIQIREFINNTGQGKLYGHAIKFDSVGRIIEIFPSISAP